MSSLYAVQFSTGVLKVGRTKNPEARMAQHRARLAVGGAQVERSHSAQCFGDAKTAEAKLIAACTAGGSVHGGREWFTGLEFDSVCSWLNDACALPAPEAVPRFRPCLWENEECPELFFFCRACCGATAFDETRSRFLCARCEAAGYSFDNSRHLLSKHDEAVALWSRFPLYESIHCVTCEELNPGEAWIRVRASSGFPLGFPLLDVSARSRREKINTEGAPAPTEEAGHA